MVSAEHVGILMPGDGQEGGATWRVDRWLWNSGVGWSCGRPGGCVGGKVWKVQLRAPSVTLLEISVPLLPSPPPAAARLCC